MAYKSNQYQRFLFLTGFFLLAYTLVPLILVSYFNAPTADDFKMANVYNQSSFWVLQKDTYLHWSGRYFATAILWLHPLLYAQCFYNLLPLIILITLFIAQWLAIKTIFCTIFTKVEMFFSTALCYTCLLAFMPSIAEGIYWAAGSLVYTIPIILCFILMATLYKLIAKFNILNFVLSLILLLAIIGSNEAALFSCISIVLVYFMYHTLKKGKFNNRLLILLDASVIFAAIAIFAPGNFERMQGVAQHGNLLLAIAGGTSYSLIAFMQFILPALFISILLVLICIKSSNFKQTIFNTSQLKYLLFCLFMVSIFSVYALNFYSTGSDIAGRTNNIIFVNFLLLILFASMQFGAGISNNIKTIILKNFKLIFNAILLIAVILLLTNNQNINQAYVDIITGSAKNYKQAFNNRQQQILAANNTDTIFLPAYKSTPKTLFIKDIETSNQQPDYWVNEAMATYYNKNCILKIGETAKPTTLQNQLKNWFKK